MRMPAPISPVFAAIPIPPPAEEVRSHSSSSSSSFVSWCESEHGSLPTTHQRLLDTAKQHRGNDDIDTAPTPTTSAPPATKVGLQTSVDILQQFYGTGRKGRRVGKVKTPPKAAAQVVTDDEGNHGEDEEDDDSDTSSYDDEEEDELDEDGNDSYDSSSDESVPEIVEVPASADRGDEDLSSIFDMSLGDMFSDGEEGEVEFEEAEEGRDEPDATDYGPGIKTALNDDNKRDNVVLNETAVGNNDTEANANSNIVKVTRFELPSPTSNKPKKKGVSFADMATISDGKAKKRNELLPESKSRSNTKSTNETGKKKKKRRSRYISSASSTKVVIQSFMSHTRASMAKTRRSLSKISSPTKATGTKPSGGTKNKAKRDDNNTAAAAAGKQTDSNVTDAVARAKQRIRQHRNNQRASM